MELRHLRCFVAVAEELNFTRAAEELRLAQPSLTRQVHNLEEELGVRLLDRGRNRVSLTEEGKSFLVDARRLLALSLENVESVQRFSRGGISTTEHRRSVRAKPRNALGARALGRTATTEFEQPGAMSVFSTLGRTAYSRRALLECKQSIGCLHRCVGSSPHRATAESRGRLRSRTRQSHE